VNQRGFGMVEVLIVLSVLGIIAGLAIPRFNSSISQRELDIAARELAADLRWMQQTSVNSSGGAPSLGIASDPLPSISFYTTSPYGYYITINSKTVKKNILPASVQITGNYKTISFGINGYLNSPVTIKLRSGTYFKSVIVDAAGRVRIW